MAVKLFCIVSTLPNTEDVIVLSNTTFKERRKWDAKVSAGYEEVRNLAMKQMKDSGEDPALATLYTLPYLATINHVSGRVKTLHNKDHGSVTIEGPAGVCEGAEGVRLVAIHKAAGEPSWPKKFLKKCKELGFEDISTLETRSDRAFLKLLSEELEPPVENLKVVSIPCHENIRLTKNIHGEYVSQVAKVWK